MNSDAWPADWIEKGKAAKARLFNNPGLSINSSEYHDYMDYCTKVVIFESEKFASPKER